MVRRCSVLGARCLVTRWLSELKNTMQTEYQTPKGNGKRRATTQRAQKQQKKWHEHNEHIVFHLFLLLVIITMFISHSVGVCACVKERASERKKNHSTHRIAFITYRAFFVNLSLIVCICVRLCVCIPSLPPPPPSSSVARHQFNAIAIYVYFA